MEIKNGIFKNTNAKVLVAIVAAVLMAATIMYAASLYYKKMQQKQTSAVKAPVPLKAAVAVGGAKPVVAAPANYIRAKTSLAITEAQSKIADCLVRMNVKIVGIGKAENLLTITAMLPNAQAGDLVKELNKLNVGDFSASAPFPATQGPGKEEFTATLQVTKI